MNYNLSQISNLLGASRISGSNQYDLVTGNNIQDSATTGLQGLLSRPTSALTSRQQETFSRLEKYISDNVDSEDSPKLLESLSALKGLLELNSTSSAQLDPIFSLLGSNLALTSEISRGSLLDISA